MSTGSVFGVSIGVGAVIGLMFDQKYIMQGVLGGIAIAGLIVMTKNKKDEKE
jgi:hypothetical protein